MNQLPLDFHTRMAREKKKRDEALDLLEERRAELIAVAKKTALDIALRTGTVTSTEVFERLRNEGWGAHLDAVDPRFMGAVFRKGGGWERVGYVQIGSHGRPVAQWRRHS